jgi:hypothetical protein
MDALTILITATGLLAMVNLFIGDHSWAPYLASPLTVAAVAYLLIAGGLSYLGEGTLADPMLSILLWILSLPTRTALTVWVAGPALSILLWTGVFLATAQFAYLYFSIETWQTKHPAH